MLKIYIQIFGTIALVAIILINYNFFYRTPAQEEITKQVAARDKLLADIKVLDGILEYAPAINRVETRIDYDRRQIELELPRTFSVPDKIKRIYDLILACDLQYKGIVAQSVQRAKPVASAADYVARPNDQATFGPSVTAFQEAMAKLDGPALARFAASDNPADRAVFYMNMADAARKGGWKPKANLAGGFERHRYQLTGLSGTYGNIKKFLWMVSQDKPMMQATSVRITPKAGIGESRLFTLDVTIVAYADRNTVYEQLNADPGLLLKAAPKAEKKPAAGETKEAAKP